MPADCVLNPGAVSAFVAQLQGSVQVGHAILLEAVLHGNGQVHLLTVGVFDGDWSAISALEPSEVHVDQSSREFDEGVDGSDEVPAARICLLYTSDAADE